jgi:NHLM bacteriocin system ABC transporter peptidase/ATP-binding protein
METTPPPAGSRRRWKVPLFRFPLVGPRGRIAPRPGAEGSPKPKYRKVRTPTIMQMEAVECGAACLAMVLAHHGVMVPLEEVRAACGVSRDGSKASNVVKAARRYALEAKGFRKEPAELRELPVPMIVHWNFNHFVVLDGFHKGRAYLNDPAQGPRQVPDAEFDESFTGVALTFEKGPDFKPGGVRPGLLNALLPRLAGSRVAVVYAVLVGLALVVPALVVPTFSRVYLDDVLVKGLAFWLRPLLIVMAATAILQAVLTWLQQHYLLKLETKLAVGMSSRFFWHVLRLPVGFFTQRYAGEVSSRVSLNDRVAQLLSGELATTVLNIVMIAFYAGLMMQYDVVLTLLGVGTALLNLLVLRMSDRRRTELSQRLQQDRGKMLGVAMGGLQTIETLKATGSESDFFARWAGHQAKTLNANQKLSLITQGLTNSPPMLLSINTALLLGVGGMRVMDGHLSMGMLMAFQGLMTAFLGPVNRMVGLGGTLHEVKANLNRLDDVLRAELDPNAAAVLEDTATGSALSGPPGRVAVPAIFGPAGEAAPAEEARPEPEVGELPRLAGYLELRDVSFGYSPLDPPLIEGFNLKLRPGSRVALVGGSGCGKSTVSRLVAGLYPVWTGEVLFDGRPRSEIAPAVLASSLAVVDQDVFLFEGTIRDNLSLWDTTLTDQSVVQAARDASIHPDVSARNNGYQARVEEGGRNFSGGQRQRLELARALAGAPSILVLDEATSALDPVTEKEIDDALRRRGCTCLIVAHRLSTIRDCDEIIVMERGKIVQRGTHEEMIGVAGPYRDLIALE